MLDLASFIRLSSHEGLCGAQESGRTPDRILFTVLAGTGFLVRLLEVLLDYDASLCVEVTAGRLRRETKCYSYATPVQTFDLICLSLGQGEVQQHVQPPGLNEALVPTEKRLGILGIISCAHFEDVEQLQEGIAEFVNLSVVA